MVPRQTWSRLPYLVATARCWRSLPMARSTVLRCLQAAGSKAGGRPPLLPRRRRLAAWPAGSGMVALLPRRRRCARGSGAGVRLVAEHPPRPGPGTARATTGYLEPAHHVRVDLHERRQRRQEGVVASTSTPVV